MNRGPIHFLPLPGWPVARYRAGDDGRIYSHAKGRWRPLKSTPSHGRPRVALVDASGKAHTRSVAALICRAFHGPRPIGCEALHYPDPDKTNCRPENLRWAPRGSSMLGTDRLESYRPDRHGEQVHTARLTAELVAYAREAYSAGATCLDLATEIGVSESTIRYAINGTTWNHLPGAIPTDKGRAAGTDVPSAKLDELAVLDIRRRSAAGESTRSIANQYGLNWMTIHRIVRRQSWRQVRDEGEPDHGK